MTPEAKEARDKAGRLRREANAAKAAVERMEGNCPHEFGPIQYDPIVKDGYTDPGDVPGTMGIDWRGPVDVPRKETKRWSRVCRLCGKVEYTTKTEKHVTETPRF